MDCGRISGIGTSYYDIDYLGAITADGYCQHDITDDTSMVPMEETVNGEYSSAAWKEVPAEEGLRCDDADFMRWGFQGNIGFEIEAQFIGGARECYYDHHGLQYIGHNHK